MKIYIVYETKCGLSKITIHEFFDCEKEAFDYLFLQYTSVRLEMTCLDLILLENEKFIKGLENEILFQDKLDLDKFISSLFYTKKLIYPDNLLDKFLVKLIDTAVAELSFRFELLQRSFI